MKKRIISIMLIVTMLVSINPMSSTVFAKGSDLIQLTPRETAQTPIEDDAIRYSILTLDYSGSMDGTPLTKLKESVTVFVDDIAQSSGTNYVAVVAFSDSSRVLSDFVDVSDATAATELKNAVNNYYDGRGTNTYDALISVEVLLDAITEEDVIKNVVLLTDGQPDSEYSAKNAAQSLKDKGYYIYSLGFFHSINSPTRERAFLQDVQNAGYYEVIDPNELSFAFGQIIQQITKTTGTFTYASPVKQSSDELVHDFNETFIYDDAYFSDDAHIYNPHLATMSLCFELSAWNSNDTGRDANHPKLSSNYANKSVNAQELLKKIGFSGIAVNEWFTEKPEMDSIGVIGASKSIRAKNQDYTLIAVAIRGGGYESEWASNFTMGTTGQHEGFREAKENVLAFLRAYVAHYNITGDIKLWLTGYSRAGATANLVAGALDDAVFSGNTGTLGNSTILTNNDIYTYTFETPKGALLRDNIVATSKYIDGKLTGSGKYGNIFNYINPNDFVPYVAPEEFDFGRYGVDVFIPTKLTSSQYTPMRNSMVDDYYHKMNTGGNAKPGYRYSLDEFTKYNLDWNKVIIWGWDTGISTPEWTSSVVKANNTDPTPWGNYIEGVVGILANDFFINRNIYALLNEKGVRLTMGTLNSGVTDIFIAKVSDHTWDIVKEFLFGLITGGPEGAKLKVAELLSKYLVESWSEAGLPAPSISDIASISITLGEAIGVILMNTEIAATVIKNFGNIPQAHYPELCLAWLQYEDLYYGANAQEELRRDGFYRVIRINCPIDVEVYSNNVLVASIIGDESQNINNSSIVASVNSDGEKLIYLPPDANYDIQMTATDDGIMTYTVQEKNVGGSGASRIVNYYEIQLVNGDTLRGTAPLSEEDNIVEYKLFGNGGQEIIPNEILTGENVQAAQYIATVTTQGDGITIGGGKRYKGEFTKLTAIPNDGYKFVGWYLNGNLVSLDNNYRFCVLSDVIYTAKFEVSNDSSNNSTNNSSNVTDNIINNSNISIAPPTYTETTPITDPFVYEATFNDTPVGTILGPDTTDDGKLDQTIANAVIYARNKTLKSGDKFVIMEGVTAKDDGGKGKDLTKKITLSGIINTKVPGKYIMHYKVRGQNGNIVSKDVTITVVK